VLAVGYVSQSLAELLDARDRTAVETPSVSTTNNRTTGTAESISGLLAPLWRLLSPGATVAAGVNDSDSDTRQPQTQDVFLSTLPDEIRTDILRFIRGARTRTWDLQHANDDSEAATDATWRIIREQIPTHAAVQTYFTYKNMRQRNLFSTYDFYSNSALIRLIHSPQEPGA